MADIEDWKEESAKAVTALSSATASSTATGLFDVAKASTGVTYVIVNHFHFATGPADVPNSRYEELLAKVRDLETQIEALPGPKSHAFKCKDDFDRD